jgi:hypothetical protein
MTNNQEKPKRTRTKASPYKDMSLVELLAERSKLQDSINDIDKLLLQAVEVLKSNGVIGGYNPNTKRSGQAPIAPYGSYTDDPTKLTIPAPPPPQIDNMMTGPVTPPPFDPSLATSGDLTPIVGILDPSVEVDALHDEISKTIQGIQAMDT